MDSDLDPKLWKRVIFFRSARLNAIAEMLSSPAFDGFRPNETLVIAQEDTRQSELHKVFGECETLFIPAGGFELSSITPQLFEKLLAFQADAFIIPYNDPARIGYEKIESMGLLLNGPEVIGISERKTLNRVSVKSITSHTKDKNKRWLSSPYRTLAAENFLNYLEALNDGDTTLMNYPWYMYLELSRNCNLRCPGCRSAEATSFSDLSFDSFKEVIDEVGPYLYHLVLYRGGESLINKNFFSMLEYAYEKTAARLVLSSNMSHRLPYDKLATIVKYCHLVDVTIDGITPQTYSQYRVKGNFDLAFSNLLKLSRLAEEKNGDCHIRWRFIVFNYNEHEVPQARKIASDFDIDLQLIRPQIQRIGEPEPDKSLLPKDKTLWRPEYGIEKNETLGFNKDMRCGWLHGGVVMNYNMTLSPCCEAPREFSSYKPGFFKKAYNCDEYVKSRHNILCEGCHPSGREEWGVAFTNFENEIIHYLQNTHGLLDPSKDGGLALFSKRESTKNMEGNFRLVELR